MVGRGRESPDAYVLLCVSVPPLSYKRERTYSGLWDRKNRSAFTRSRPNTRTHAHATQRLGTPLPLSLVSNPYYKLECKTTRARTGHRDIPPKPV